MSSGFCINYWAVSIINKILVVHKRISTFKVSRRFILGNLHCKHITY